MKHKFVMWRTKIGMSAFIRMSFKQNVLAKVTKRLYSKWQAQSIHRYLYLWK